MLHLTGTSQNPVFHKFDAMKSMGYGRFFEISAVLRDSMTYLQPIRAPSQMAVNAPLFRANLCPLTFVDVPPHFIEAQALLGIYEMGRVELLRDLFIWAYERSTQEYVAIRQHLAEPEPLQLSHRCRIKDTVRAVVLQPGAYAQSVVDAALPADLPEAERQALRALILDELRRLHEGVLARDGLRPASSKLGRKHRFFYFHSCQCLLHKR